MLDTLKFTSTGRPVVECPRCHRLHPVFRRGDYLLKPVLRFHCKNSECKCTWAATPEDTRKILEYYQQHKERKPGRPSTKAKKVEGETKKEPVGVGAPAGRGKGDANPDSNPAQRKSVWAKFLDVDD